MATALLRFDASLHAVRIDAEGESTVTFKVPLNYRDAILELSKQTQRELVVVIGKSGTATMKGRFSTPPEGA